MKGYFVRRINFIQGLAIFFLGFALAAGSIFVAFVSLLLAVGLDALNGWLSRDRGK